ncbi:MAG: cell wall hydrolase [Lachnospiraceae bacterium]|nr:cell wall hydrolase [Lachnospiraceae bacterium]
MRKNSRNHWKNKLFCMAMAVMLFLMIPLAGMASQTSSELKKTGKKIDELKERQEEAKEQVDALEAQESGLQGELSELNTQLSKISGEITDLEQQIAGKQVEIEVTQDELQNAWLQKEEQYKNMKQRIRYIYEDGGTNVIEILLSSTSMSDLLNKAEYVEAINEYDRQMLTRYENTCEKVAQKEQILKAEKENLQTLQADMEQKQEQVNSLIAETQKCIQSKQEEIANAQDAVAAYDAQIAKMKAYEEELERKKAEEAKRLAEERKKQQQQAANQGGGGTVSANTSDVSMLAALVECEAGGESYEGQWAVASVVVNRVRSGRFPNTVSGVIYQGGQFSPVASGRFAVVLSRGANASCVQAAKAALSGNTNISALYFCSASAGVSGTVIGNHVFY